MADNEETLGVDLRTRVKRMGVKEKVRRMKCNVTFSLMKKKGLPTELHEGGVKKLLRAGMVPARTWRAHAVGCLRQKDKN